MDKVLVMNVCDGVECKFWRHISIKLGLARWLIGGGWYNGQGAGDGSNGNVCGMSAIYPLNWGLLGG